MVFADCAVAVISLASSGWTPTSKDNKEKKVTIKAEEWIEEWTSTDLGGIGNPALWIDERGVSCF